METNIASASSTSSRIPNFFKMDVHERLAALSNRELLSDDDLRALEHGDHTLKLHVADKMIENVVGVLGLPLGVAGHRDDTGRTLHIGILGEVPNLPHVLFLRAYLDPKWTCFTSSIPRFGGSHRLPDVTASRPTPDSTTPRIQRMPYQRRCAPRRQAG